MHVYSGSSTQFWISTLASCPSTTQFLQNKHFCLLCKKYGQRGNLTVKDPLKCLLNHFVSIGIFESIKHDYFYLQMSSTVTGSQCFKLLNRSSSLSCWMTPVNKINLFLSEISKLTLFKMHAVLSKSNF